MIDHYIAFWNLENLFDVDGSPARPEWLQKALANELKGWDQAILDRKIKQLSSIIRQMNDGQGPDVLGVCEVENKPVVDLLVSSLDPLGRNYAVAHHDTGDKRGIDVAFIYDSDKFTAEEQYFYVVLKRQATRDIFQVNFTTASGNALILIGNHWPARSGGVLRTEPYRIIAAETLSYWDQRILEIRGKDIAVVIMGDFNDEPHSRSVVDYALATNSETKVREATKAPRVLNLMWPFLGKGMGTHYYDNFPNVFDQFWIFKGIVTGEGRFKVKVVKENEESEEHQAVKIEMFDEMVSGGDYPRPIRYGRPSKKSGPDKLNTNGFSDHYPISMTLQELD